MKAALEVHEHSFVSGPRAHAGYRGGKWTTSTFAHSHEGGDVPHQHLNTGPATYTIDKDDWFRSTGLRGGGRKKYTAKPTGEQFAIVELEDWQKSWLDARRRADLTRQTNAGAHQRSREEECAALGISPEHEFS